jgi:hypothetical protein
VAPPEATAGVDLDLVPALLRRIRQVPVEWRRFTVGVRAARSRHRIHPGLLDLLAAEGLPHVGSGADRLFDDYDLGNAALHLGLLTVQRMTMRSWASGLRRNSMQPWNELRVGVVPRCPVAPHAGPCAFQVLREGGRRETRLRTADTLVPVTGFDVRLPGEWPELGAAARELLDEVADLDFFLLPEAVRWDGGFMARTRMADCGGVADWLAREGQRRGLAVRFSFGLLVVKPYSTPHCWVEFRTDGVWVPQDPLLRKAMCAWAGLDPVEWHPYRSIGSVLHRLCGHFTKVVAHGGVWAPLSLPTDYLAPDSGPGTGRAGANQIPSSQLQLPAR